MKKAILLALVVALAALSEPLVNRIQALTTSTAYRVSTTRTMVSSLFIQVPPGNTSFIYVLYADEGTTCSAATTSQIAAYLGPGSSTQPGQSYSFPSNGSGTTQAGGFNAQRFCVEGSTGDSALISYDLR